MANPSPPMQAIRRRYGVPDLLVANDGNGRFVDVSPWGGSHFERALIGRGSAIGDLDGDGDLDLIISNLADRVVVLRNDTQGGHWLTLELIDAQGSRGPDGIDVWVTIGDRRQHRRTHPCASYLSQSDRRPHFGVGSATTIDQLDVRWPDGAEQTLRDVSADQVLTIQQPRQQQ